MSEFSNRVVIVTGATGNLGTAVAHTFDKAGAKLALFDRNLDHVQHQFSAWDGSERHLFVAPVDATDSDSMRQAVAQVVARWGAPYALVNIVGGYRAGDLVHETSLETWDFMLDLNARSAFLAAQIVVPHMLETGAGTIINIGARPGLKGTARHAAYAVAKAGVIRLTESLSAELKQQGVRVNCILPGTIDTPQNREQMPDADFERWVTPEALAAVIYFLCSDAAAAIHGAAIPAYGLT